MSTELTALSPLDGRYAHEIAALHPMCSEFGLMRWRVFIEIRWLETLAALLPSTDIKPLTPSDKKYLTNLWQKFSLADAARIKTIEQTIHHDVKAVEYFLQEKISANSKLQSYKNFLHFACTSDDINNLAYGLMMKAVRTEHLLPAINSTITKLRKLAHAHAAQPMLSHTHGQPASPTTVGKEFANFVARLEVIKKDFASIPINGKFNGTVGNLHTHSIAYPKIDWRAATKKFVLALGLNYNAYTTQIEPHDNIAAFCDALARTNTIMLDLCRDVWGYIAFNYFQQKSAPQEVGSSVMPHKINPIDFENAEGNLGIANALLHHYSAKLPISRWQRDLSDSTVMRNLGVAFGHTLLAYKMVARGLDKITVNKEHLAAELSEHWEILGEAIQTVMRRHGILDAYNQLKKLTRGKKVTQELLHSFIKKSALPAEAKKQLLQLTPLNYLGKAVELAKKI